MKLFSCEICEIFKNSFFYRTPPVDASVFQQEFASTENTRLYKFVQS